MTFSAKFIHHCAATELCISFQLKDGRQLPSRRPMIPRVLSPRVCPPSSASAASTIPSSASRHPVAVSLSSPGTILSNCFNWLSQIASTHFTHCYLRNLSSPTTWDRVLTIWHYQTNTALLTVVILSLGRCMPTVIDFCLCNCYFILFSCHVCSCGLSSA